MCADNIARRTVLGMPGLTLALAGLVACGPSRLSGLDCPAVDVPLPRDTAPCAPPSCPPPGPPATTEAADLCGCQRCRSTRMVEVDAGDIAGGDVGYSALAAAGVALEESGRLVLRFCADCGQVQGRFPLVARAGVVH